MVAVLGRGKATALHTEANLYEYIWVARMLWNLDPQGWQFVAVLSTLNLIIALISVLGNSTWEAMLPAILINGLILIYCLLPGTKAAFGQD